MTNTKEIFILKQIKLRPNIALNDLNTKVKHIRRFLENQQNVRIIMEYHGREKQFLDNGKTVLATIETMTLDLGRSSINSKLKGPQLLMIIQPFKK